MCDSLKRKLGFLTLLIGAQCLCSAQRSEPNYVLVNNDLKSEKIVIKDREVAESLLVCWYVVVELQSPLKDTTKRIKVENVELMRMSAKSVRGNTPIIEFSYNDESGTPYQKYIWDLCKRNLNRWYRNQPYDQMPDRMSWDKRVVLGGTMLIEPGM